MAEPDIPRCPFADSGIGTDAMAACPGYDATALVFNRGIGESIPPGETCGHIGPVPTSRGFMAGCIHPDASRVVVTAREALEQATGKPLAAAVG